MRKLLTLLLCGILFSNISNAQYVDLPDSNFRDFLRIKYPACFNAAGQMDTTCSEIVNEDSLTLGSSPFTNYSSIKDVSGLRYFKNLRYFKTGVYGSGVTNLGELPGSLLYLDCGETSTQINSLPVLPPGLLSLNVRRCRISNFPALPATLKYLDCSENNSITSLPALPAALEYLNCSSNYNLSALPALPNGLKYLNLYHCQLTSLPPLPATLKQLLCSDNYNLRSMPALPSLLDTLDCSVCPIGNLPALPAGLKYLLCYSDSLSNMPLLPASLLYLNCSSNYLTAIPDLPAGLIYLNCAGFFGNTGPSLTSLPQLPASLKELICDFNQIQSLPPLPQALQTLACTANSLTVLPTLPPSLQYLGVRQNHLRALPALPGALYSLDCSLNPLYSLPQLPNSLTSLYCSSDSLSQLPVLPTQLAYLNCQNNLLTALPEIPNPMRELTCNGNNIYCLPKLPVPPIDTFWNYPLYYLNIYLDAGNIKCIPNYGAGINIQEIDSIHGTQTVNLPLCSPVNNIYHCQSFPIMTGTAFYDNNSNGFKDIGEPVKKNLRTDLSNGSFTFTNNNGYYEIGADSIGSYNITVVPPLYFNANPALHSYNFISNDTLVIGNFALQANTVMENLQLTVNAFTRAARPGFPFAYMISYENTGTTTVSPNIIFNYDNTRLVYDSSSNAAVTDNGSSLSLSVSNFVPGQQDNFIAYFKVKPTAAIGDTLNVTAVLSANSNYSTSSIVTIRGAFDPNDKQATPQLSPSQVASGKYIDYTIRFQNTGNDTAFNIVITDTLNDDLQPATLQMITSSHNCKATVKDNIVFFEFLNILLPDSNVNELKSHGFVSFRIKPQPTVAVNTTIPNKAAIYFDYNAPVITNTAGTLIKDFTVIPLRLVSFTAVPQTDNTTTLYWNTANEINTKQFVIERGNDGLHFNALATVVAKGRMSNNYSSSVADIGNSIVYYRLKIIDNDGSFNYSPIIKIDRRKNSTGFAVLTNPVKDFIVINTNDRSLNNTTCNIINGQGAVVKYFIISQGSQAIDVKGLPNGVYYLRTVNGSSRILIQ